MNPITYRSFSPNDFERVKEIYQQGIDTKNATFETVAPDWNGWHEKFSAEPRLVSELNGQVVGWAALSTVSARPVYCGVREVSIYIHSSFRGMGIGKELLSMLIDFSEHNNIWTLQSGVFPENTASIKIHKTLGFREVGFRERIAKMGDVWRNTILLERRSSILMY